MPRVGPVKLLPRWLIRLGNAVGGSVRLKLMAMVMAPLLLGMPLLLIIVWIWGTQGYDRLMLNKVSSDLGTARQYFDRVQNGVSTGLDGFAGSHRLFTALHGTSQSQLANLIDSEARDQGLDYLLLVDTRARRRWPSGRRPPPLEGSQRGPQRS